MGSSASRGVSPSNDFLFKGERVVASGAVVTFVEGVIEDTLGDQYIRDIVRHPGAVAVVALDDSDCVTLVKQYRAAVDGETWELPAGKLDIVGESPKKTAARELEEEVGLRAKKFELLLNVHHSPGFCDEYTHIYLATGLSKTDCRFEGPEEKASVSKSVPLSDSIAMVLSGEITDAKSISGLFAAAHRK